MSLDNQRLINKYSDKLHREGFIAIPVHMTNPYKHWFVTLLKIDASSTVTIFIFDSSDPKQAKKLIEGKIIPFIGHCMGKNKSSTRYVSHVVSVPKQTNGYDCGVYAMNVLKCLMTYFDNNGIIEKTSVFKTDIEQIIKANVTPTTAGSLREELYTLYSTAMSRFTIDLIYRGIVNLGHSCWINATLQFLFTKQSWFSTVALENRKTKQLDTVWKTLLHLFNQSVVQKHTLSSETETVIGGWNAIDKKEIISFLDVLKNKYKDKKKIPFLEENNDITNEDCGELLTLLADDEGEVYFKDAIFQTGREKLTCKTCNYSILASQDNKSMSFIIYINEKVKNIGMQNLLDNELVEIDLQFRCRYCYHVSNYGGKKPTEEDLMRGESEGDKNYVPENLIPYTTYKTSQLVFTLMPVTLIIQISRIQMNLTRQKKNEASVDFMENGRQITIMGSLYSLVAIIYHTGGKTNEGHYTCDSFRPTKVENQVIGQVFRWHSFDDDMVTVQAENYWENIERDKRKKNPMMKKAVLLMYNKVDA